jgi:hypothetical protein
MNAYTDRTVPFLIAALTRRPSGVFPGRGALLCALLAGIALLLILSPRQTVQADGLYLESAPAAIPGIAYTPDVAAAVGDWIGGVEEGVSVLHPDLVESVERLRSASPAFSASWDALAASGVSVLIGMEEQLRGVMPSHLRGRAGLAGVTVSWGERAWGGGPVSLDRALVAVRMDLLDYLHPSPAANGSTGYQEALDRLLVHEIYGHLAPVVEARSATATCPDARPGERREDSCVWRREQVVLREVAATRSVRSGGSPQDLIGVAPPLDP